jgi:DNA-binding response OmpR family regulator
MLVISKERGLPVTTASSNLILIAEDDKKTAALIKLYVEREGFRTALAYDGKEALAVAHQHQPILIILDLMLPAIDGWEVSKALRKASDVPILILSARKEEIDRILGLSLGADDYVVKPFSPRELIERVKAILRRARPRPANTASILSHGALVLDKDKRRVRLNGQAVALTPSEYKILYALMSNPGRVFDRQKLLNQLYPLGEAVTDRIIDVHVVNLRQKIEADSASPRYIYTVKGIGYHFADAD